MRSIYTILLQGYGMNFFHHKNDVRCFIHTYEFNQGLRNCRVLHVKLKCSPNSKTKHIIRSNTYMLSAQCHTKQEVGWRNCTTKFVQEKGHVYKINIFFGLNSLVIYGHHINSREKETQNYFICCFGTLFIDQWWVHTYELIWRPQLLLKSK